MKNLVLPDDLQPDEKLTPSPPSVSTGAPSAADLGLFGRLKQSLKDLIGIKESQSTPPPNQSRKYIKKIMVVGVHGWYPSAWIMQRAMGEFAGTSVKFANVMTAVVEEFKLSNSQSSGFYFSPDAVTECVALDGHGTVGQRIDMYLDEIIRGDDGRMSQLFQQADLILFVSHSQGVPVTISLVAALISAKERIIVPSRQVVGLLGMAGVCLGPFPQLKESFLLRYLENGEACRDLFEFCNLTSDNSKRLHGDMLKILESGVRVSLVAGWRDQVVPLFSALMTTIDHPRLRRAVYIDSHYYYRRDNSGDPSVGIGVDAYLVRLMSFLIKLRNSGMDDDGLLMHLSWLLGGNLYTDSAHSTIYDWRPLYREGIKWIFQNWDTSSVKVIKSDLNFNLMNAEVVTSNRNGNYIPWSLSRLSNRIFNSGDLLHKSEFIRLIKQFDKWATSTKGTSIDRSIKTVRYRLEPMSTLLNRSRESISKL